MDLHGRDQVGQHTSLVAIPTIVELASVIDRLDLEKLFGRKAPLNVDLGCGDGSFICTIAQRVPEKNFLGIERMLGRIRSAARKGVGIRNVRLLHVESSYAVRYLLPAGSVEMFYLSFPDPWPKRRHRARRMFSREFLDSIAVALEVNGILRFVTDQLDYFQQMERLSREHPEFQVLGDPAERLTNRSLPPTKFERRFREQGVRIHLLELRKISPVT